MNLHRVVFFLVALLVIPASLLACGACNSCDHPTTTDAPADVPTTAFQPVSACAVPGVPDAGVTVTDNIVYTGTQRLNVVAPTDNSKVHPAIVMIHGGGWTTGDKYFFNDYAAILASLGYVTVNVNYRLVCDSTGAGGMAGNPCSSTNVYPAALQDVRCAVRWTRSHAADYDVDPTRIGVWGESAGADLAEMLLTGADVPDDCADTTTSVNVRAAAAFYPSSDLLNYQDAGNYPSLTALLGQAPADNPALALAASPVSHVHSTENPLLILHGTADTTIPYVESVEMHAAVHEAGAAASLVTVDDAGHDFPSISTDPAYVAATCTALAFMAARLQL